MVALARQGSRLLVLDENRLLALGSSLGWQAEELLPALVETFVVDAELLLDDARRALADDDGADLCGVACALGSLCRTFGAMELALVVRSLELDAGRGQLDSARAAMPKAYAALARARHALLNAVGTRPA